MMNRIIYTLVALFLVSSLFSQKLESFEYEDRLSVIVINIFAPGLNGTYDVDRYRIKYFTADTDGNEHLASGLICVPSSADHLKFPMACYQHGTVTGREDVPSNLTGGYILGAAFATHGYVVAMADYVGLGISPGVHPYIHSTTEASAGLDILRATRELIEQLDNVSLNEQVFVSGYSQGGHAAMALARELETNHTDEFNLIASAPMSGPYSVSEKMRDFTLSDEEYETVSYLAWLTLGYQRAYPATLGDLELADVFKPEYLNDILEFKNENIPLYDLDESTRNSLNDRMQDTLLSTAGSIVPKNILQPNILDALLNDPSHPLSIALADNDNYDWAPQVPTNLYYCEGDDQVTFENAILAEEVMTTNGSTSVTAIRMDTDAEPRNHTGCVSPASLAALEFFDSFSEISEVSTNVKEFDNHPDIQVYGSENTVSIDISAYELKNLRMDIYDMNGRRLLQKPLNTGKSTHLLRDLAASGIFVIAISDAKSLLNITKLSIN